MSEAAREPTDRVSAFARMRRPRIRFSLRTLLAFIVLLGLLLAAGNYLYSKVQKQHENVQSLLQLGAYVAYDNGDEATIGDLTWETAWFNLQHDVTTVVFRGFVELSKGTAKWIETDPTREHLKMVASFPLLNELRLAGCEVTDEDVKMLSHLPLKVLDLSHTLVTDRGLCRLADVSTLRELYLDSGERYSSVRVIFGNPIPEHRMNGPKVTDEGVRQLTQLTNLEALQISGSSVSKQSLEYLNRLTALRTLWVDRTNILEAEMAALKKANPQLTIYKN